MTFVIILVVSLALVPVFALLVYRRVDVGEARFDADGAQLPTQPPAEEHKDMRVKITRDRAKDE